MNDTSIRVCRTNVNRFLVCQFSVGDVGEIQHFCSIFGSFDFLHLDRVAGFLWECLNFFNENGRETNDVTGHYVLDALDGDAETVEDTGEHDECRTPQ